MLFKGSLRESIQENGVKAPKGSRTERSYRRFFEGYTAKTVLLPGKNGQGGRYRTEYVYTGDTYHQELSRKSRIAVRCLYVACWLLCCFLLGRAATRAVPANTVWYVTIFQAGAFLGLLWMLPGLIYYVTAGESMTVYTYRTMIGFHFRVSRLVTLISLGGCAIGSLLNLALDRSGNWGPRLSALALLLVCAALIGCICYVEQHITYVKKEGAEEC